MEAAQKVALQLAVDLVCGRARDRLSTGQRGQHAGYVAFRRERFEPLGEARVLVPGNDPRQREIGWRQRDQDERQRDFCPSFHFPIYEPARAPVIN